MFWTCLQFYPALEEEDEIPYLHRRLFEITMICALSELTKRDMTGEAKVDFDTANTCQRVIFLTDWRMV